MTFHIHESKNGQYFGFFVQRNGETLNTTETLPLVSLVKKNFKSIYRGLGGTKKIKVITEYRSQPGVKKGSFKARVTEYFFNGKFSTE